MPDEASERSPTATRTRSAILDAAVRLLARKRSSSMGEIAEAAGIARSTVHRHFPERADLLAALEAYAANELEIATANARLDGAWT